MVSVLERTLGKSPDLICYLCHRSFSPEEISKIDANNALFYHFNVGDGLKGPEDAFKQIQAEGCSQIALKWVTNHWSLILWKLASIVRAKPSIWEEKWSYSEVIRQLKYR
jgi:breast cancer 2 susceptibility protein